MNFKSIIIRLYYVLIHCDGKVNDNEIALGKRMMEAEDITEAEFDRMVAEARDKDSALVQKECIIEMKRLSREQQVRSIAWLCVLANADGFMDRQEWQFIYKIYHKELRLTLDEIMSMQKELLKKVNPAMVTPFVAHAQAGKPRLAFF